MINTDELYIVNYCHKNCTPFMNICRLSETEAFKAAKELALQNPNTTAFYRFADFENYYPRRMKTDELLYRLFNSLGGKPKEKHPLSFVLSGSEFLNNWFGNGIVNKIKLKEIPSEFISFTLGDSMTIQKTESELVMYTKEMMFGALKEFNGTIDDYLNEIKNRYNYIEAQLWNDEYCKMRSNNQ